MSWRKVLAWDEPERTEWPKGSVGEFSMEIRRWSEKRLQKELRSLRQTNRLSSSIYTQLMQAALEEEIERRGLDA